SKGVFQIPYRCLYSRNIKNLFFAGRIISVSHVAFGATRVMATSAYVGQAVAVAAALCKRQGVLPRALYKRGHMVQLQRELMKTGQHIPGLALADDADLVAHARLTASSTLAFSEFSRENLRWKSLDIGAAQLVPVHAGAVPVFSLPVRASVNTALLVELRVSSRKGGFTPDTVLATESVALAPGITDLALDFGVVLEEKQYVFLTFLGNPEVQLPYTNQRITGLLSVFNGVNKKVSNNGYQQPPVGSGVDEFEFWCPQRRPEGQNIAIALADRLLAFEPDNIRNGVDRPVTGPNAWVADPNDVDPYV